MRQNHPPHLMCKLEPPGQNKGHKRRTLNNIGMIILWVREPGDLNRGTRDEREEEEEGRVPGVLTRSAEGGSGGLEDVEVAVEDVDGEADSAENHESFVKTDIRESVEVGCAFEVEDCPDSVFPDRRTWRVEQDR